MTGVELRKAMGWGCPRSWEGRFYPESRGAGGQASLLLRPRSGAPLPPQPQGWCLARDGAASVRPV